MAAHRSVLRSHAETPRVLTGADLWGNASAIAAHQAWVRAFTNASIIIGVQKSGTTALGALLRIVLGLREKSHRKELHMFATPRSLKFFHRKIEELTEDRWLTDATPNYFQSLTALLQYRIVLPHARFWLVLRDPIDRAFSAWDQNRRAEAEQRTFNVAVHQELRDLLTRCTDGGPGILGARRGINATGAARIAGMLGTQLRVARLAREMAETYTRWPPCLQRSCWLSTVDPDAPACKEYLVKGLAANVIGLWRARYGRALTVVRLEDIYSNLTNTAFALAAINGVPRPTALWQRQALAKLEAQGGCFHACKQEKANQSQLLHRMNSVTERKLMAFYAADQAALRRLDPNLRWPRFDAHVAAVQKQTG